MELWRMRGVVPSVISSVRLSDWILTQFLETIVIDKDLNEISTLKEEYDHDSVILCQFHVLKVMKSGIAEHCKNDKILWGDGVSEMIYSATERTYLGPTMNWRESVQVLWSSMAFNERVLDKLCSYAFGSPRELYK